MPTIVPPTLMNLAGLPGGPDEPHVRNGNHLRVAHHPLLGLPVAPFVLQRASLDRLPDNFAPRRDVIFRDAAGNPLTLPIVVQKGDEVRATIVQGAEMTCVWVAMLTRGSVDPVRPNPNPLRPPINPIRPVPLPTPGRPPIVPVRPIPMPGRPPIIRSRPASMARERPTLPAEAFERIDQAHLREMLTPGAPSVSMDARGGELVMRAYGASLGQQAALLGERREAPYTVGAPAIAELVITGRGIISDLVWLAASDVDRFDFQAIAALNLPHEAGLRYLSISDAIARSEKAVRSQAPKRRPLQETTGATAPSSAPSFSEGEESDRVHALADGLSRDLDVLIDGATPPLLAAETIEVTDSAGNRLARPREESVIRINHLGRVLQASLDPGVAAWLGYKGLDDEGFPDTLAFYRVYGFFRHPNALGADPKDLLGLPLNLLAEGDRQLNSPVVFRTWIKLAGGVLERDNQLLVGQLEAASDYMVMGAVAAIDRRAVPEPPAPPEVLAPQHVSWLPAVPPAAVREVECPLRGLLVGATLTAEREQPLPGGFSALNRAIEGHPWHTLLTVGLTSAKDAAKLDDSDGRQGVIADRAVGPDAARYHFAQQDRFGRWSEFARRSAAPGERPKPPRPVVEGSYRQPQPASSAVMTGGTFTIRVPLPEAEALAPGSFPLSHVRLSFRHFDATVLPEPPSVPMPDVSGSVATAIVVEDSPPPGEPARRAIPITVTGPVLTATAQRRMVITAAWIDTGGQVSVNSEPLRLLMTDPRPPAQVPIPETLLYSSRPDATGLAWIERSWPVSATNIPGFAIYYTDEIRLVAWLKSEGRTSEAEAIAATGNRAARAGMLRAIQSQFPDYLFERLPGAVIATSPTERRFRHALSGSSRVLNAYKIAAEAPNSGARPALAGLDTVFYGVPNSDPPPRPSVSVRLVEPEAGEPDLVAEVTVTLEPGVTPGITARIFRTRGTQANAMHAPIVSDMTLSAPDGETGRQTVVLRDVGAAQIAPAATLTSFARYQWFAQVQGAPESGSAVPGMWSRPSDPVSLATVPLETPAAPVFDGFGGTAVPGGMQNLTLTISHPLGLKPSPLGSWRYEILRAPPGEDWAIMAEGDVRDVPLTIPDPAMGGVTPSATSFMIRVFDPIGRPLPALLLVSS